MLLQLQIPPEHVTVVFMPTAEKARYLEADVWVAIGTVLLAIITAWLARETRKLRKDGADGVKAAMRSAKAAEDNALIARETMHNTLRAYVVVKEVISEPLGSPARATVKIVNTGQTPSQNQYCFCEIKGFDTLPETSPFVASSVPHDIRDVLGVSQTRNVTRQTEVDLSQASAPEQLQQELVLHGLVRYQDMFSSEVRLTAFCYVWDFYYKEWVPKGPLNFVR